MAETIAPISDPTKYHASRDPTITGAGPTPTPEQTGLAYMDALASPENYNLFMEEKTRLDMRLLENEMAKERGEPFLSPAEEAELRARAETMAGQMATSARSPAGPGSTEAHAWKTYQDRLQDMQRDIVARERYDPLTGEYGDEYRRAIGWDVGRGGEIGQSRGAEMMGQMMQMQAAQAHRERAAAGPQISPLLLRAQQNQLAQQVAAQRAAGGGGAMATRAAMMAGTPASAGLAQQGIGQMLSEQAQQHVGALGALGSARAGALRSSGVGTELERAEDAYRHARRMGAMEYLGMGERAKQGEQAAMIKLLGSTTRQEQEQPTGGSSWREPVAGTANLLSTAIAYGANQPKGDTGSIIDPAQLKTPTWAK